MKYFPMRSRAVSNRSARASLRGAILLRSKHAVPKTAARRRSALDQNPPQSVGAGSRWTTTSAISGWASLSAAST